MTRTPHVLLVGDRLAAYRATLEDARFAVSEATPMAAHLAFRGVPEAHQPAFVLAEYPDPLFVAMAESLNVVSGGCRAVKCVVTAAPFLAVYDRDLLIKRGWSEFYCGEGVSPSLVAARLRRLLTHVGKAAAAPLTWDVRWHDGRPEAPVASGRVVVTAHDRAAALSQVERTLTRDCWITSCEVVSTKA